MGDENERQNSALPQTIDDLRGRTPEELRSMVDVLDAHLRSLHQNDVGELRELDEAEQSAFDLGLELREFAIQKIEEHGRIAEIFRRRPKSVEQVYKNIRYGLEDDAADVRRLTVPEARDRALRVLDSRDKSRTLDTDQIDQVERYIRRDTDIARRILVTETEAYRSAWQKLVTTPGAGITLSDEERAAIRAWEEYRAMAEGGDAGYGVPVFIDPSIILTAQGSGNPYLQLCRQATVNTNAWKGVSSAGVSWAFQAEAAEVTDDSPTLDQPVVNVNMARGFIPFSIEVDQDYPGFADEMSNLLAAGYDELLVNKFTLGSGSDEPKGLVTALLAATTSHVEITTKGSLGAVDVYNVWQKLPRRYKSRASWMMDVSVNNKIRQLGTADSWHSQSVTFTSEWADQLFGHAVYDPAYMVDLTTSGVQTPIAVVGDFQNYLIARRGGMSVELLPLLIGTTNNRPTGQRGWFAWSRIGGNCINAAGFRLLHQTAT